MAVLSVAAADWRAVALATAAASVPVVATLGLGWSERPGSWLGPALAAAAVAAWLPGAW